jgi:hypothetical protein
MDTKQYRNINIMTDTSNILTIDNLTKAIQNSVGTQGIDEIEARRMAEHMMNFFGYSDRIIDNVLEPEDRDVFYMMEDSGILMTEREETTLYDGREWRINYWLFRKDKIFELTKKKQRKETKEDSDDFSVYQDIPEEVWSRE